MLNVFIDQVINRRFSIVICSLLFVAVASMGLQYLVSKTDYRVFFSDDNPQLIAFDKMQAEYTKSDSVLFVIEPNNGDVFTKEHLSLVKELTDRSWELPMSMRVDSLVNFQHTEADDQGLVVAELVEDTDALTLELTARIKSIALNEPQLVKKLVSTTGHVAAVNVIVEQGGGANGEGGGSLDVIATAADDLRKELMAKYPNVKIHISGILQVNYASELIIRDEMVTLVPIMIVVVLVVLALMLRSFSGTLATLIVVNFSVLVAMGLMGWMKLPITGTSGSAPTIVLTMAVADCVHILVTYFYYLRQGYDKKNAMASSLRLNFQPIFITSLTTGIGFLTMNFSDVPPFHDLGNVVTIGVVAAFVFSITFLPAFMMIMPVKVKARESQEKHGLDSFADFVVNYRKPLFWGMGAAALAIMAFIPRNEINDDFLRFISKGHETRDSADFTSRNLSGFYGIEYSLVSHEPEGIYSLNYLRQVDEFVTWLREQPEVDQVITITDVFKRLNRNLHGDEEEWYRLPESNELSAQYLLLYEMSLPFGLDLNNMINFDKTSSRIIVNLGDQSTAKMLALEKKYEEYLNNNLNNVTYAAASTTLMFSHIGMNNARSMFKGTTIALLLISAILVVALRSWKIGLLSIVPNLIPAGLAFGVWAIAVSEVGISIAIAIGMTMGIVVDNTVHFLSKYVRVRREEGMSAEDAVRYAFSNVGVALLVTNLVLIVGFLVLAQSNFVLNSNMGYFTAVTFVLALIVDFLFLPPLLLQADGKPTKAGVSKLSDSVVGENRSLDSQPLGESPKKVA